MIKEIFKDVPGYEGAYQVSDKGNVKSLNYARSGKERVMRPIPLGKYSGVTLFKEGKSKNITIHKLVAMAFLGHVPDGHKVDVHHIDEVKTNNNLSNLEILTRQEHTIETWKSRGKTSSYTGVSWYKKNKKWRVQMRVNDKQICIGYFDDELEASEAYKNYLK